MDELSILTKGNPTPLGRIARWGGLVVAVVAVIAVIVLVVNQPKAAPAPTDRELTSLETAGTANLLSNLTTQPTQIRTEYSTSLVRVAATYIVIDGVNGVGTLASGSSMGAIATLDDKVFLRGDQKFWASLGATTTFGGWVDATATLGDLPFPLQKATSALTPGGSARVSTSDDRYHAGGATATITPAGISRIEFDKRAADFESATDRDSAAGRVAAVRNDTRTGVGALVFDNGALRVDAPRPPAQPRTGETAASETTTPAPTTSPQAAPATRGR